MTNQTQNNGGKENDTPKKSGSGEMNDVPAFVVQGSSSMTNMPEHLIQNHDKHQKQQAQQQQEHQQEQQQKKSTKQNEKASSVQQGDTSIEQKKQQQQEDKYHQLDQQDHLDKTQDKTKKNQDQQQQPKQQQQAQPQQFQTNPTVDAFKGKWEQQVGAAKITWGKLTDDELLKSEGHAQKLAGLVQERYAISRAEADKQVKAFIDKCKC